MSGVYLTLWDEELKDKSEVLRPTRGGWPHITVAYTGILLPLSELVKIALNVLPYWVLKDVMLQSAYVSTFEMKPSGKIRHDVLISMSLADVNLVNVTRATHLLPYPGSGEFAMRTNHVMHSIHDSKESAEATVEMLNRTHLPRAVRVTGVAID
jgi:hypothetical protein